MTAYRIYLTDKLSYIETVPKIVECSDDRAAIKQAAKLAAGCVVELWQCARFVVRLGLPRRVSNATPEIQAGREASEIALAARRDLLVLLEFRGSAN